MHGALIHHYTTRTYIHRAHIQTNTCEHTHTHTHTHTHKCIHLHSNTFEVTKKLKGQTGQVQVAALGSLQTAMRTLKEAQGALRESNQIHYIFNV